MSRHRSHQRQSRPSSDQIEGLRLKPCCGRRMGGFTGPAELPPRWVYPRRRLILKFAACALTNISSNKATKTQRAQTAKKYLCFLVAEISLGKATWHTMCLLTG